METNEDIERLLLRLLRQSNAQVRAVTLLAEALQREAELRSKQHAQILDLVERMYGATIAAELQAGQDSLSVSDKGGVKATITPKTTAAWWAWWRPKIALLLWWVLSALGIKHYLDQGGHK